MGSREPEDSFVGLIRSESPAALEMAQAAGPELQGAPRQPQAEDLAELFATYGPVWRVAAARHGVRATEVLIPTSPVPVLVDRVRFLRIILNLIDNAGRALSEAGRSERGAIKISVWRSTEARVPVRIQIVDNGPGFPRETLLAVNSPTLVSRVPSTKAADGKPHGVGLASTKETIVDRWHGEIHVDSTAGEGSVITIWLQAALPTAPSTGRLETDVVHLTGASARHSFTEVWEDFHSWLSLQPGGRTFQAGDRYGTVPIQLRNNELRKGARINVFPIAAWAAQFPELRELQQSTGLGHPLRGAFGHLVVRVYRLEGGVRTAVLIEEAESGEGYLTLTPAQQHELNGWRSWLVQQLLAWATARGHVVFGPEHDTELCGGDQWRPVTLRIEHSNGAVATQHRSAYRGNEAIQARWAPRVTAAGLEEWEALPIKRGMEPALRERWAVETLGVEA